MFKQNKKLSKSHAAKNNARQKALDITRRNNIAARFLLLLVVLFVAPAVVSAVQSGANIDEIALIGTGGTSLAFALGMGAIGNVEDVTDLETVGAQIAMDVRIIDLSQIDTSQAFPMPNASREVGTIPMKSGQYMTKFESHNDPTYTATGEKSDYTIDPTKEFGMVLGGTFRDQILNYVENKAGQKCIILFRRIESTQWYMIGTYDKPMIFSGYEFKNDNDAAVAVCKYTNKTIRQFYKYTGSIVTQNPVTVAADATTLAIASDNERYQLSDNTGATVINAISGVAAADVGRTITVYGSGGSNPATIADSSTFVLANGATWTGNSGSQISFRILDTGTLVETERVQTA